MVLETQESWDNIQRRFSLEILESGTNSTKHNSVRASFQMSYHTLRQKHESAVLLFSFLGLFPGPENIVQYLEGVYSKLHLETLEEDMAMLTRFGLIDVQKESMFRVLFMHPLIHHYAQEFSRAFITKHFLYRSISVGETVFVNYKKKHFIDVDTSFKVNDPHEMLVAFEKNKPLINSEVLAMRGTICVTL